MKRKLHIALLVACLFCGMRHASAQYYTWGADAPMKWSTIRTPDVRMIFPDTVDAVARRTLFYIRTVQPAIAEGFTHGPMRIPFVMHPENFRSNGLVMYLPKRVEFLTAPAVDSYSMPWLKQLVAHEYRHAVQYNNLDRGVIRVLSYLLGQQGSTIGLLCMPIWAMEGDAVMSETAMSSFGRGLQPSFTIGYRALGRIGTDRRGRDRRNIDKWFCGSYRDYVPDHYELGYQICSYAYDRYGENVWNKVARFGSRNPYMLATTRIALQKYYGTNVSTLFRETFDDLERYWASLPVPEESSRPLVAMPERNYTTYRWPLPLDDTTALVLKEDYDRPSRFVAVDTRTGAERTLAGTGAVSTRPVAGNGRVWWTEYRRSKLFEQRVGSQLCWMNLADGATGILPGRRHALYPVSAGETLAWVEYDPSGRYSVVVRAPEQAERRYAVPDDKELHGLAWDDRTAAFYTLVTDDSGMWIGRIDAAGLHPVTAGAYVTLSDLRAADGRLYFGSIASGRDEVHGLDLATGREYRLTTSVYGSFDGAPGRNGELLLTSYDRRGYRLAVQEADGTATPVEPARLPQNVVNPPRRSWRTLNLDTVRFTGGDSLLQAGTFRNVVNAGATLVSQNLLSSAEGYLSYGYNRSEGSIVKMGVRYFGLGVHLDLDASYGGNQLFYALASRDPETGKLVYQSQPSPDRYYSVGLSATLPLYFQCGYRTRQLSISTGWNYSNGMVADMDKIVWHGGHISNIQRIGFLKGLHKLAFGVGFSDQVRLAHRDFAPRWGYALAANYTFNPSNRYFSDLISFYAQSFLPGFAAHNSLRLAVNYQTSLGGYKFPSGYAPLSYRSTRLVPQGFTSADILADHYLAFAADYQLPVWYPEGGIGSVLYFKRVRLNLGGTYAQFRDLGMTGMERHRIWAAGGDVIVDFNVFRQPASATSTVKLSVYRPSNGGVWTALSLGLPF